MQINIRTFIAAIAVVMGVGFQSANAADVNLNNGWKLSRHPSLKQPLSSLEKLSFGMNNLAAEMVDSTLVRRATTKPVQIPIQ